MILLFLPLPTFPKVALYGNKLEIVGTFNYLFSVDHNILSEKNTLSTIAEVSVNSENSAKKILYSNFFLLKCVNISAQKFHRSCLSSVFRAALLDKYF